MVRISPTHVCWFIAIHSTNGYFFFFFFGILGFLSLCSFLFLKGLKWLKGQTMTRCYHGDQKLLSSQADCCSPLSNQLLFQHRIFTKWKYEPLKSFPLALICEKEECHETLFIILRQSAKNMLGLGWWYFLVTMVFGFWTCSYFV